MQLESSHQIVQKIIRDYNIVELGWVEDSNEWVKEALEHIGTTHNKILIKKDFETTTGSYKLPCEAIDLIGVLYNGCFATFQSEVGLEKFEGVFKPWIKGNTLYFNMDNVKGTAIYYASLTNCDGELLFDGHIKIKEAITNYVMMRLLMRGYKHPVLSYEEVYKMWNSSKDKATNYGLLPNPYEMPIALSEFLNPLEK